jgi:DNA-binding beta-propeller fold protein YncE
MENEEDIRYFCPGMFSVIKKDGKLKGYQTYIGNHISNETFQNYMNNNKERLIEFTKKSKYWYVDWKPLNFLLINNEMTLIDLDSFRLITKTTVPTYKKNFWGVTIDWYINTVNEIITSLK